jgi:nucleoside-diphosphate-sugar epimerase
MWIDMAENIAAIPGNGDQLIAITHSRDVGRIIPLMLSLPKWRRRYYLIGNRLTLNEVIRTAEQVKGVHFEVQRDDPKDLERGQATLTPHMLNALKAVPKDFHESIYSLVSQAGLNYCRGYMDLDPTHERTLNEEFPHVKLMSIEEVAEAWRNK